MLDGPIDMWYTMLRRMITIIVYSLFQFIKLPFFLPFHQAKFMFRFSSSSLCVGEIHSFEQESTLSGISHDGDRFPHRFRDCFKLCILKVTPNVSTIDSRQWMFTNVSAPLQQHHYLIREKFSDSAHVVEFGCIS